MIRWAHAWHNWLNEQMNETSTDERNVKTYNVDQQQSSKFAEIVPAQKSRQQQCIFPRLSNEFWETK